jgi:hypothetical protein
VDDWDGWDNWDANAKVAADGPPHGGRCPDGRVPAGHGLHQRHRYDPDDPSGPGAVTTEPADATWHWRGTFQVDGVLTDGPAHVGSAGCTAIGYMALDLRRAATSPRGSSVSGRLRVWAVATSGTACGRRDISQGSLLGTLSSDGPRLQAGSFRLLGVSYGWLSATITNTPVGAVMQMQQMRGQFGDGHSGHRSLHGAFTLARGVARADTRATSSPATNQPPHLPPAQIRDRL